MTARADIQMLRSVLTSDDGEWDWNGPLPGALSRILDLLEAIPWVVDAEDEL